MAATLVYVDLLDGAALGSTVRVHPASLAALAAARRLADGWGATLYAAVVVHTRSPDDTLPGLDALEVALGRAGADKVVVAQTDVPVAPLWSVLGVAWGTVLDHLRPRLVLFGAGAPATAELAARTGARIGARLLTHALALGLDDVELRDREGGYVRASDSGATVAIVHGAAPAPGSDDDIDLLVLDRGPDRPLVERLRIELERPRASSPVAAPALSAAVRAPALVALGDDALAPDVVAGARRLADLVGGIVVGGRAAVAAGAVPEAHAIERHTAVAPELCIAIGKPALDLAGATVLVRVTEAAAASPTADAQLVGGLAASCAALADALVAQAAIAAGDAPIGARR